MPFLRTEQITTSRTLHRLIQCPISLSAAKQCGYVICWFRKNGLFFFPFVNCRRSDIRSSSTSSFSVSCQMIGRFSVITFYNRGRTTGVVRDCSRHNHVCTWCTFTNKSRLALPSSFFWVFAFCPVFFTAFFPVNPNRETNTIVYKQRPKIPELLHRSSAIQHVHPWVSPCTGTLEE